MKKRSCNDGPLRLGALPLPEREHALLFTSINNYQRYARLVIDVMEQAFPHVLVRAFQVAPAVNGRVFTTTEIRDRLEEVVEPLRGLGWVPVLEVG